MKKMALALLLVSSVSQADIVCRGELARTGSRAEVVISQDKVTVAGGSLKQPQVFKNLQVTNGLITSRGLAVTFEDNYGCLRDAVIITDFGSGNVDILKVDTCSGGSTPDPICQPSN